MSSAVGRMLFGRFSDVCSFKNIHVYRACMFLSGLASVLCPLGNTYWALVVYVVVLGILDGSYIGLMSIVTLDIVGVHKIAPAWGILFFCQSFTYLLGPPAAGKVTKDLIPLNDCYRLNLILVMRIWWYVRTISTLSILSLFSPPYCLTIYQFYIILLF